MYHLGFAPFIFRSVIFRPVIFALSLLILAFTTSCTEGQRRGIWQENNDKIKILCTTAQVASLVIPIVGDFGDVKVLIQGQSDPHSYQLVKGDDEKFIGADIIFASGLGLEHTPALVRQLERKTKLIIGDVIIQRNPEAIIRFNGMPDPHIWMDVSLWSSALPAVVDVLTKLHPKGAEVFKQRGEALQGELVQVHEKMLKTLQALPQERRYLVTTHDAFSYFTRAYLADAQEKTDHSWGERCFAPEGLAPDAQISTQDIMETVEQIIKYNVHYIFAESNVSQDSIKRVVEICDQKSHKVQVSPLPLYADAMGSLTSEAATYPGMMLYNSATIAKLLGEES